MRCTKLVHCGLPAEMYRFVNPGIGQSGEMPTTAMSVLMQLDDEAHLVAVRVGAARPDDPMAARAVATILTGFQPLRPAPS